jgi:hypothetical protein
MLKEWVENAEPRTLSQDRRTPDCDSCDRVPLNGTGITDVARQDYLSSYEGERFAESMRYVRTYPEQLPVLRDLLPMIGRRY